MNLNVFIKTFLLILCIDILYLFVIRRSFITSYFSKFGGDQMSILYGLIAWCLLSFGIEYFIVQNKNPFWNGMLFGLVVYGVYDFTNLATINGWTLNFAIQDILWGMILCGTVGYLRTKI